MSLKKDFLGTFKLNKFLEGGDSFITRRGDDFKSLNPSEKTLFRNDIPGSSLKSTQQIPLDWSKFENHTFFNSAQVNVNVAFNNIINGFPFDGTRNEIDLFLDNLTGFEKWIFDNFPKSTGSLHFKNCYIAVDDIPGALAPDISKKQDGRPILDSGKNSISFQFKAYFPQQLNDNQVIVQRLNDTVGYTLAVSRSLASNNCDLLFIASSGSSVLTTSLEIQKGKWHDIAAVFNRRSFSNKLLLYIDGRLVSTSSNAYDFLDFNMLGSKLIIGSGSRHNVDDVNFLPISSLSASIDDFKVFHGDRSDSEILNSISSSHYQNDNLKLYYKFNEPLGSYSQKNLVLDSSANGLHAKIIGYTDENRKNPDGLFKFKERKIENPVLFPDFSELVSFNQQLLASASNYDEINPNLITRLVPSHYFYDAKLEQGFDVYEQPVLEQYNAAGDAPGSSKMGASQILSSLLYIWAKQFDEIKIFLDHFSKIESYEYEEKGSIADQFLIHQASNLGIDLPKLFNINIASDEDDGDDFGIYPGESGGYTLQQIQAKIWRRIIATAGATYRSKGTIAGIKDIIRAYGVNPDTSIRLREYGGSRQGVIESRKPRRTLPNKLLGNDQYTATSIFLSGSRIEPGIPLIKGTMTPLGSDAPSDGLYTSGSWTYEATYKFPDNKIWSNESLVRFYTTGSVGESLTLNLVARKKPNTFSGEASLTLFGCTQTSPKNNFELNIPNFTLFDGDRWHVSFGRNKIGDTQSDIFLRVSKQASGQLNQVYNTILRVTASTNLDVFSNANSTNNSSGSYFRFGQYDDHNSNSFLDVSTNANLNVFNFGGEISSIRFYSKYLEDNEWYEHVVNHESFGVKNPLLNYNFITNESGSFERLRIDVSVDQENKTTNSFGNITLFDYSQNNSHILCKNFEPLKIVIDHDDVSFSSLDAKYDERSADNKIRIRSWEDYNNVLALGGELAPITEVPRYEQGDDDNKFGVEISIVQGLNEDIVKMFSDFSAIDLAIGDPSNAFDDSYTSFEELREIYFNRLTSDPEYSNVIIFCKWFESSIGRIIEQFIPANTRFLGVNLVVESHMLERHKMKYHWGDVYLNSKDRKDLRGNLLLAALETSTRRF